MNVNVIWKKGDSEMPDKAKKVVNQAQEKLLLSYLNLPDYVENQVIYNSDKNHQTVPEYLSSVIVDNIVKI